MCDSRGDKRKKEPELQQVLIDWDDFIGVKVTDHWYTELQTESYRMLGWQTVQEATAGFRGGEFEDLFRHVASTYLEAP